MFSLQFSFFPFHVFFSSICIQAAEEEVVEDENNNNTSSDKKDGDDDDEDVDEGIESLDIPATAASAQKEEGKDSPGELW